MRVAINRSLETGQVLALPVPPTSWHWAVRLSVRDTGDAAANAQLELRGDAGTTVLWVGQLDATPILVPGLTVTLPGARLALVSNNGKPGTFHLEASYRLPGEQHRQEDPCAR